MEHKKVYVDKKGDVDQKHRSKQRGSQPQDDQFYARNSTPLLLEETSFHPKMDEHAATLLRIPFAVQRQEYIMQLNNAYGLRYVQRLIESVNAQAKLTVSNPGDKYEQEAEKVADEVTREINVQEKRQAEDTELVQMTPNLQLQEENDTIGFEGKENTVVQRASLGVVVQNDKGAFDNVAGAFGGDLNSIFGITYPMEIKTDNQRPDELIGNLWVLYNGLMAGQEDVDTQLDANSWQDKINDLVKMGSGHWYSREAVTKHEQVHVESFIKKTNTKEKTIMKHANENTRLARWRSFCDVQGNEDHKSNKTDNAELPIIIDRITQIWVAACASAEPPQQRQIHQIKSMYNQKVLKTITLNLDGTVS